MEGLPPSAEPDGRFDDHLEALLELSVAPEMTPRADSFRLLKLHGSLSWYWSPGDATGATLQRWRLPGTFGHPIEDEAEDRRRVLPGRVPFIVPPAALKSEHLKSPIVRELWRRADESFRQASASFSSAIPCRTQIGASAACWPTRCVEAEPSSSCRSCTECSARAACPTRDRRRAGRRGCGRLHRGLGDGRRRCPSPKGRRRATACRAHG